MEIASTEPGSEARMREVELFWQTLESLDKAREIAQTESTKQPI